MIVRHLLAALVAGLMAGILMTVVQQARVVPLILHAEEYEDKQAPAGDMTQHGASMSGMSMGQMDNQSSTETAAASAPAAETHEHQMKEHEEGGILFGLSRFSATLGANLVAAGGYALLLMAVSLLSGKPVTVANGLIWGACGWLAVQFLPAMGLPPELPGFPAADLASRQLWWVATIVLSAGGMGLIAFRGELAARIIGLLLILSPHVWGAPQPPSIETAVPAVLASEFAVAALGAALVMWLSLGFILGYLNARMEKVASMTLTSPGAVLVLGGARSGKSRFAEGLVTGSGLRRHYLATGRAWDEEMQARIASHRADRGPGWVTVEEPLDLVGALGALDAPEHIVLVDCLTLWVTNLMLEERDIAREAASLAAFVETARARLVFVTNEVGLGIVPENRMAREFRDHAGRLHQMIATVVPEVYFVAAGLPLKMKG